MPYDLQDPCLAGSTITSDRTNSKNQEKSNIYIYFLNIVKMNKLTIIKKKEIKEMEFYNI